MNISDRIDEIIKALAELRDGIGADDSGIHAGTHPASSAVSDEPLILDDETWLDECGFPLVEVSSGH